MINNSEKIKDLLEWRSEDDFYFIQVLQRKKDHNIGKVNGTNNNSRLIKAYYVKDLEHLDFIMPEIIQLCEIFGARAGINLNRRSFKKMQLHHISKLVKQMVDGTHNKAHKAYNSVVGAYSNDSDKKWILDIDLPSDVSADAILGFIDKLQPVGPKFLAKIVSKNGYHLITKPFDLRTFNPMFPEISIHKNNPTNLYIP